MGATRAGTSGSRMNSENVGGLKSDPVRIITAAAHDHTLPCTWALTEGYIHSTFIFETWFGYALLPCIPAGYAVVLHSTKSHRRRILRAMAHASGVHVLFLPPCASELCWATSCSDWLKRKLPTVACTDHGSNRRLTCLCLQMLASISPIVMQQFVRQCRFTVT